MTLQDNLRRLAKLRHIIDLARDAQQEYDAIKQVVNQQMIEAGSNRTIPVDGYFVVRSNRVDIFVQDEEQVLTWLKQTGLDPADYMTVKKDEIKGLAKAHLREYGEIIPGTQTQSSDTITVRKAQ